MVYFRLKKHLNRSVPLLYISNIAATLSPRANIVLQNQVCLHNRLTSRKPNCQMFTFFPCHHCKKRLNNKQVKSTSTNRCLSFVITWLGSPVQESVRKISNRTYELTIRNIRCIYAAPVKSLNPEIPWNHTEFRH
jgi:hypothetical protein